MKELFCKHLIILFLLLPIKVALSGTPESFTEEIKFINETNSAIYVKCFPISMIFDADFKYTIKAKNPWFNINSNLRFDYNNGVYLLRNLPDTTRVKKTVLEVPGYQSRGFQHDQAEDSDDNYGSLGFGKYKRIW